MKAYVYRSGHVMIGPSIPEGAIEIADWDNEAELLTVLRWSTSMVEDVEGSPCMVKIELVANGGSERAALAAAKFFQTKIQDRLRVLHELPQGKTLFIVSPVEKWSPESVEAF